MESLVGNLLAQFESQVFESPASTVPGTPIVGKDDFGIFFTCLCKVLLSTYTFYF